MKLQKISETTLPAMTEEAVAKVREMESRLMQMPQAEIETRHVFHAGVYARSMTLPANGVITGALIKIPTLLIVSGDVMVYTGEESVRLTGYHVLVGQAGRKQAFVALQETNLTMLFATQETSVEGAEMAFTDEYQNLLSRRAT